MPPDYKTGDSPTTLCHICERNMPDGVVDACSECRRATCADCVRNTDEWFCEQCARERDERDERDSRLCALIREYKALHNTHKAAIKRIDVVNADIRALVRERDAGIEHDGVVVTMRAASTRTTWDAKGLAGYAVAHPAILAFRKTTRTLPSVQIKIE